jgi:hypothetical protein
MPTRRAVLSAVALVIAAPLALSAQNPVAGRWTLNVDSPQGATSAVLNLSVDGDAIKGTISSDMGETPISGTVSGSQVKFTFDYAGPSGAMTIMSTATVSGDDIKGDMDYGQGVAPFTGKRAKS